MLPLPTNARAFFVALLRWEGASEEQIEEQIESLSQDSEYSQYLMLQGGSAGVAEVDVDDDSSLTVTFGSCEDVVQIFEIACDVYNFTPIPQEALCQK